MSIFATAISHSVMEEEEEEEEEGGGGVSVRISQQKEVANYGESDRSGWDDALSTCIHFQSVV